MQSFANSNQRDTPNILPVTPNVLVMRTHKRENYKGRNIKKLKT